MSEGSGGSGRLDWPEMGALLAVVWLAVRGVPLVPIRLVEELLIGVAVGVPLAYAGRRFYRPVTGLDRSIRLVPYLGLYVATFVYVLVTASVDVARRVLSPSLPIEPAVMVIPLRVESDLAVTTIANSITLTPGTLTMDYDSERNVLFVHSLDGSDVEAVIDPIRQWEDYALVVFDERLKPGDPLVDARPIVVGGEDAGADAEPDEETTESENGGNH